MNLQEPECDVQGLYENKEYEFRVCAVNENGEGDYLNADSSIVAKLPFGKLLMPFFNSRVTAKYDGLACQRLLSPGSGIVANCPSVNFLTPFFNTKVAVNGLACQRLLSPGSGIAAKLPFGKLPHSKTESHSPASAEANTECVPSVIKQYPVPRPKNQLCTSSLPNRTFSFQVKNFGLMQRPLPAVLLREGVALWETGCGVFVCTFFGSECKGSQSICTHFWPVYMYKTVVLCVGRPAGFAG